MQCDLLSRVDALLQVVFHELVHQEADRATVHAEDFQRPLEIIPQGIQHQAVTTKGDNDLGVRGGIISVALGQCPERVLRIRCF